MPAIVATQIKGAGRVTVTETTLNGSDTLVYNKGKNAILTLRNPTGGPLSPVIDGDGGGNLEVDGLGVVDLTGGYVVGAIAAGATISIRLDTINAYLSGVIAVNSGSTLIATLLET